MRLSLLVPSLVAAACCWSADSESTTIIAQADVLTKADKGAEAITLLDGWCKDHPDDKAARSRLLSLRVAQSEAELRSLVRQQADERDLLLGDVEYEDAKRRGDQDIARRLSAAEYLIHQGRSTDALDAVNAILRDHPEDQACLRMKYRLLERLAQRQREVLERNRKTGHDRAVNESLAKATFPDDKPTVRRQVFIFDEDMDELERARITHQLEQKIEGWTFDKAKVWDVMEKLFKYAGIQYVVVDSAIGDETLSLNIQNATIQSVLETVGKLAKVRFAYDRGMVFVASDDSDTLVTEIIHLRSGLTNVDAPVSSTSFSSSSNGEGSNGAGGGLSGNNGINNNANAPNANGRQGINNKPNPANAGGNKTPPNANSSSGANGGSGQSDLEKFIAKVPDIIVGWPSQGTIYLERKSNTLYVRSTPWAIAELKRLIAAIDYNNVQVLIQARFIEVSEDAFRNLGVQWSGGMGGDPTKPDISAGLGSPGVSAKDGAQPNFLTGTLARGKIALNAKISALEQENKADTLAEPKILTLNNSEGSIEIVSSRAYVSNYTLQTNGYGSTVTNGTVVNSQTNVATPQLSTLETGIQLKIKPSVARNSDIITLHLQPTIKEEDLTNLNRFQKYTYIANPSSDKETTLNYETPTVATRTLETSLHIQNGESVALGGMIKERDASGREGTPFLSRIPVLGGLFGSKHSENQRSNLIILVSANIVDPSGAKVGDEIEQLRDTARILLPPLEGDGKKLAAPVAITPEPAAAPATSEPTPHIGPTHDKTRR